MQTNHITLAALFGFASLVGAQQDPIQAQLGADWTVERHTATGTPRAIYGPGLRVSNKPVTTIAEARTLATKLLRDQHLALGLGTSTVHEIIGVKLSRIWSLVYQQQFKSLPVIGGRADVRLNENGVAAMFGAVAVSIPEDFVVRASVTGDFATDITRQHLQLGERGEVRVGIAKEPRLVIWSDLQRAPAKPQLAFEVRIDEESPLVFGRAYVDAHTGEILNYKNDVLRCNHSAKSAPETISPAAARLAKSLALRTQIDAGLAPLPNSISGNVKGWVTLGSSPLGATTNVNLGGVLVTAKGVTGDFYTDVDGNFLIPHSGTSPIAVTVNLRGQRIAQVRPLAGTQLSQTISVTPGTAAQFQLATRTPPEFMRSQTDSYYHVNKVNEWIRSLLPPSPSLDRIDLMRIDVNDQSFACNAAYKGLRMYMFASGSSPVGNCNNSAFSEVLYHEWGHGLDDVFGGVNGNNTREGLSEGWADILGVYLIDRAAVGSGFGNPALGRSAINKVQYSAFSCTQVSPHCAGQSFVGFAWQFREALANSMTRARAITISENIVLPAIATDPATQPAAILEIFLIDDDDGDLNNGTPHFDELKTAALAHSIPYPKRLGMISHTALSTTNRPMAPRIVRAQILAQSGTISSAKLQIVGSTARPMILTASANQYIAILPGAPAASTVGYWIEATLSSGQPLRFPTTGAINYLVTEEQALDATYRIDPEQVAVGSSATLQGTGTANKPVTMLFGTSMGPTNVPGLPLLEVGGQLVTASSQLDAQGTFQASLPIPNSPSLKGLMMFSQLLTFNASNLPVASNPSLILAY